MIGVCYNGRMTEKKVAEEKGDFIDSLVAWGCRLLHLTKYQKILTQLAKFVIAGVITTAIDWAIYFALCHFLLMDPLIAQLFSFTASTAVSFYINTVWVFDTTKSKTRRRLVAEFFFFSFCGLVMTEIMLYLFIDKMHINYMIAKIIATAVVMVFNFVTRKMFLEEKKMDNR